LESTEALYSHRPAAKIGALAGSTKVDPNVDKPREADSAQPDFWSQRYQSGRTPWQLDYVPEQLDAFIRTLPVGAQVLIPGCGGDWKTIRAFGEAGHRVTAIDFSSVALEQAERALGEFADTVILDDFFNYDFGSRQFDIVYERTFLCSLHPRLWTNYAARVAQLLRPKGKLVGFFFYGEESEPPPYPLSEATAKELFADRFELARSEAVTDSLPIFRGMEKWQEWQMKQSD
jgi:thiopurine S-methyltransferase